MVLLAALAGILLTFFLLDRFGAIGRSKAVMILMHSAVVSLTDPGLDDLAKERLSRSAALQLLRAGAEITLRLTAAVAVPLVLLWLGQRAGLFLLDDVAKFLTSWVGIAVGLGLFIAALLYRKRSGT